MKYSLSSHSYAFNRRSKQGDWICLKCANYNYSFRHLCNRCQQQERDLNEHWLNLLGVVHYGELSFPSALFLNNENNLYYKNHHESQENPESPSLPIHPPHPHPHSDHNNNQYPLISAPERQHPSARLKPKTIRNARPQYKGGPIPPRGQGHVPGEDQLSCGKWINELLD